MVAKREAVFDMEANPVSGRLSGECVHACVCVCVCVCVLSGGFSSAQGSERVTAAHRTHVQDVCGR